MITEGNKKYLYDEEADIFDEPKLDEFFEDWINDDLPLFLRNEYPEDLQETINEELKILQKDKLDVEHLDASGLHTILNDKEYLEYNILILYHAVWDQRCAALVIPYEKIAEYFKQEKYNKYKLIIAKINGEENDITNEFVDEYPALYLYKNTTKEIRNEHGIQFNGHRTPQEIIKFIKNNLIIKNNHGLDGNGIFIKPTMHNDNNVNIEVDVNGKMNIQSNETDVRDVHEIVEEEDDIAMFFGDYKEEDEPFEYI